MRLTQAPSPQPRVPTPKSQGIRMNRAMSCLKGPFRQAMQIPVDNAEPVCSLPPRTRARQDKAGRDQKPPLDGAVARPRRQIDHFHPRRKQFAIVTGNTGDRQTGYLIRVSFPVSVQCLNCSGSKPFIQVQELMLREAAVPPSSSFSHGHGSQRQASVSCTPRRSLESLSHASRDKRAHSRCVWISSRGRMYLRYD